MSSIEDKVHSEDAGAWLTSVLEEVTSTATLPALPSSLEAAWDAAAAYCELSSSEMAVKIASHFGLRTEPLPTKLSEEAVAWMHSPVAREYGAVPVRHAEGYLVVAVANPAAPDVVERLSFISDMPVELVVAPPSALRKLYESDGMRQDNALPDEEPLPETATGEFRLDESDTGIAVVTLCNLMLRHAMTHSASDIHVQPVRGGGMVRMRIDGLLRNSGRMPDAVMSRLISRVKAVAGMNPTDRLRPQDGHARILGTVQRMDMRISTLPVAGGEKLVIRLLGGHRVLRLADLDLPQIERRQVQNLIDSSMGVVLVAGPTGSGKTTTLYSILNEKNTSEVNIVTVEDPVEVQMPRLAQTEVNMRGGLDFSTALRSVLRQDPDIILIGEIRDADTAAIAMQAAITGHLVFASIHANDAVSVLPRLTELRVSPDLAGEAVRGVISQRLLRGVCRQCAQPAKAPWTVGEAWLRANAGLTSSVRAVGCPACAGSGYKGRLVILQVLSITPELARLLDHGAPLSQVRQLAREQGMRFLAESALERVARHQTTLDEVLRVMGTDFWREIGLAYGKPPVLNQITDAVTQPQGSERGAVLVVAKNDAWRSTLSTWISELGWQVIAASDEQGVRKAMTHDADFALAVVDLEDVDEQRSRLLLDMRATLAGAAVPLLVFPAGGHTALAEHISHLPYTRLMPRPIDVGTLRVQMDRALR